MNSKTRRALRISTAIFGVYMALVYSLLFFSASGKRQIGNNVLPEKLQGKSHNDYKLNFTRAIPRSATSLGMVEPPIQLIGSPMPIPTRGSWQISLVQVRKNVPVYLPYAAFTSRSGLHFRIGARWDTYDHYYTFPSLALKRVK